MALHDNVSIEAKSAKPVTSILLPFCVELNKDIFLEIVKSVVWHSKMEDEYLESLKSGMTAKTLCVKSNDLLVDWKELTSKSQRLRKYQLIGYWATQNFPALGNKLFGESWKALHRQSIEVVGNEAISSDAVGTVIMRKMKLRSIELNVCENTLSKLRHFVRTPTNTGKYHEIRIRSTMKSFDIEGDDIEKCWKALRYGNPPMSELQKDSNQPDQIGLKNVEAAIGNRSDLTELIVQAAKRLHTTDDTEAIEIIGQNGHHLVPLVKRIHLDVSTSKDDANVRCNTTGSEVIYASDQTQIDTNSAKDSTSDSFRTLLLEIRTEIENLKVRFTSAIQTKTTDENLRKENEMLKEHIKANSSLINSLHLGVDSSTKLYQMMELFFQKQVEDSAKNLAKAEKIKSGLSKRNLTLKVELDELKNFVASSQKHSNQQIQDLTTRLVQAEGVNIETIEKNAKLDQEIRDLKHCVAIVETPLQQKIDDLSNNLSEAKRVTIAESQKNTKLEHDIGKLKCHADSVETSLQQKIHELNNSLSEAEKIAVEMSQKNAKLEQELIEVKQHAANVESICEDRIEGLNENQRKIVEMSEKIMELEAETIELKSSVASKNAEIIKAGKAEEKLNMLKKYTSSMATDLQNQIKEVEKKFTDSHIINLELISKNEKLKSELKRWERYTAPVVGDEDSPDVGEQVARDRAGTSVPEQVFDLNRVVPDGSQWADPAPNFTSDDPIVQRCRGILVKLPFGWMKFHKMKNARYYPAFVYPTDEDGKRRAQWVTADGYVSDTKREFHDYHRSLTDELKKPVELTALKKFNNKFKFALS